MTHFYAVLMNYEKFRLEKKKTVAIHNGFYRFFIDGKK